MKLQRRGFLRALAATPALSALAQRPGAAPPNAGAQAAEQAASTPAATIEVDAAGETGRSSSPPRSLTRYVSWAACSCLRATAAREL